MRVIGVNNSFKNKCGQVFVALFLSFLLPASLAMESMDNEKRYALVSALLVKLPGFISWPEQGGHTKKKELNLCVLGANPFGDVLLEAARAVVAVQKINVFVFNHIGIVDKQCDMLYIDSGKVSSLSYILEEIQGQGVFTVSEADGFLASGGMMSIFESSGRVGIKINVPAVSYENIRLDSSLLLLSR